ncbi:ileS [Symbiodinium microadriaticum]|nr:ileS [Symbiodinium microadriaticum]
MLILLLGVSRTPLCRGAEDYIVGQKYGLEVAAPVDDAGNFTDEVGLESLIGANVLKERYRYDL